MADRPAPPPEAPERVRSLAGARAAARADRDFATADVLREEIAAAGWDVADRPDGFELTPRAPAAPFPVLPDVAAVPVAGGRAPAHRATVALVVEGWPDDVATCLAALVAHLPAGTGVLGLDVGDVDGAGRVLQAYADDHPATVAALHVAGPVGWGDARTALLRHDTAPVHVWADVSTVFDGDALTPLLTALDDPSVVGAGWRGVDVDDDWYAFHDAGPGEVEALLGYLFAMRREAALAAGGVPAGTPFYRNADMEFSYLLRDAGRRAGGPHRLVVPPGPLPLHQERHRGYHDSDPAYRDEQSRRTYRRFLDRFRGRDDLRLPPGGDHADVR